MERATTSTTTTATTTTAASAIPLTKFGQPFVEAATMTHDSVLERLNSFGYCIVKGVLSAGETEKLRSDFFTFMEHGGTGIDRNDVRTFSQSRMPFNRHGLLQHYQIGQSKFCWEARSNPAIGKIFEHIWETDKLLVSFDGACFSLRNTSDAPIKPWHHLDQGHLKRGFHCVQGFINLQPCGPNDGGLVVYEFSNKYHDRFFDQSSALSRGDWYKLTPEELKKWYPECRRVKVCCDPGDFVLWDSRTVHEAEFPNKLSEVPVRMVIYICMSPVEKATYEELNKKKQAFFQHRMTSHWPHTVKLFPNAPNEHEQAQMQKVFVPDPALIVLQPSQLSARARRLAGIEPYDESQENLIPTKFTYEKKSKEESTAPAPASNVNAHLPFDPLTRPRGEPKRGKKK